MGVQYAKFEQRNSPLATDFAREFVTRQFGAAAAEKIYEALPKYQRGPHKGEPKGWVKWIKCTEGGWVRKGAYDHDTGRGNGYVMKPGTHEVEIILQHPAYAQKAVTLEAGQRRGSDTDEQWATFCGRAIYQISGRDVPAELAEPPAPEPCHPKANKPSEILNDAMRHYIAQLAIEGRIPELAPGKGAAYEGLDILVKAQLEVL